MRYFQDTLTSESAAQMLQMSCDILLTLYQVKGCLLENKDSSIHSTEELPLREWRLKVSPLRPT